MSMQTEAITVHVTPQAATTYRTASEEDRRKLDPLVSSRLSEFSKSNDSLATIMDAMSQEAANAGLTPEVLETILHGT
jgi:hypothetical protein